MSRIVIILFTLVLLSCQNNDKSPKTPPHIAPQVPQLQEVPYPQAPNDLLEDIARRGDYIDYLFYRFPISMNRDGNDKVREGLMQLVRQTPRTYPGCQADGRVFFQSQGQVIVEADLFIQEGCFYMLFYKDGKPAYANALSPDAIQFFSNITQQFRK